MPETPKPNTQAPPAGISGGRGFLVFKTVIYAVLILDAGLLYAYGSWREVTEQTGWLLILAAFEWESQGLGTRPDGGKHRAQRAMEITGYALAVFCWAAYAEAREWQNFANATVWLLIAAAPCLPVEPLDCPGIKGITGFAGPDPHAMRMDHLTPWRGRDPPHARRFARGRGVARA